MGLCRQGFKGLKSIVLSTLFNCLDMHGSNPLWPTIGYQGAPPRRPRNTCARSHLSATWLPGHACINIFRVGCTLPYPSFPARGAACLPPSAPGQVTCLHAFACLPGHPKKTPLSVVRRVSVASAPSSQLRSCTWIILQPELVLRPPALLCISYAISHHPAPTLSLAGGAPAGPKESKVARQAALICTMLDMTEAFFPDPRCPNDCMWAWH